MILKKLADLIWNGGNPVAVFGGARLVKNHAGRITLRGGSLDDRRAAREWCSHFLHEAVIDVTPPEPLPTRHCAQRVRKTATPHLQAA